MAVYRMEVDHWDNAAALDELRMCGYRHLDDELDVLGYLENYRPRWKKPDLPGLLAGNRKQLQED